jgi:predicted nucleic acid-binding protein
LIYLLDTDVVSQRTKPQPHLAAMHWLQGIALDDIAISVMTIEEVRAGVEVMPSGAKREMILRWLDSDVLSGLSGRILPVDEATADECGRLIASARRNGRSPTLGDALIASTARVRGLRLATLNKRHFEGLGVELVDF